MKKILLFIYLFVSIFCLKAQKYYIEGFYERHGEGEYMLTNVNSKGITIGGNIHFPNEVFVGNKERIKCDALEADMIRFSFNDIETKCNSFGDIHFQYWDNDNKMWIDDIEVCKPVEFEEEKQKDIVIMLILDHSSSMNKHNSGKIRWVFDETKNPNYKPLNAQLKKCFVGFNLGIGIGTRSGVFDYNTLTGAYNSYYFSQPPEPDYHPYKHVYWPITFGLDIAFPCKKIFSIGLFFSAGFNLNRISRLRNIMPISNFPINIGNLYLINLNKGSLYCGGGFHTEIHRYGYPVGTNYGGVIRLGYELNCGVYIFYNLTMSAGVDKFAHNSIIHVGYNLLNKPLGKNK